MDMECKLKCESIEEHIINYFKRYEFGEYRALDDNTRKQLAIIEEYFIMCEGELNELLERRNKIRLDIVGVSKNVEGLGRTTIYKKDILIRYINKRIDAVKNKHKEIMISEQYNSLLEKYRESETLIEQVKIELINAVENKIKVEKLEEEVSKLNLLIRKSESEKIQYIANIYRLGKELNADKERDAVKSNVVSINK